MYFDDDASPYGACGSGSVTRWFQTSSHMLAEVEQKYRQLDKEALVIIVGVKKFHQYIFGRRFDWPQIIDTHFQWVQSYPYFEVGTNLGGL